MREAESKEHTLSCGLLFLEHARELQQTTWSLNNHLFCIGCLKKSKGFFSLSVIHMPGKIVPGERKQLKGHFAT
jgi:hypothetical protein